MFTDKEIAVYQSIKAPADLCQKIAKPKRKTRKTLYLTGTIAACFILVISGFVINNKSNIVINGQQLKDSIVYYDNSLSYGRSISTSMSVPIEINALTETKVVVSHGFISINGSNPSKELIIDSSQTLWWELDLSETDNVFEMNISDKKGVEKVILKYENTKVTVTKEKVK